MDESRDRIRQPGGLIGVPAVDLHLHSTASDGRATPVEVVERAAKEGLSAIALTDHDTVAGVLPAVSAGDRLGVRVVPGCEFSVETHWGELHLLGYFLPVDDPRLGAFLAEQRQQRDARADEIVRRLVQLGVPVTIDEVKKWSQGAPIGRPHIARALVASHHVRSVSDAFHLYLADGQPACVTRTLPVLPVVTTLVKDLGGVTSAAHLKRRATRPVVEQLRADGVDGIEVRHPAHDGNTAHQLEMLAAELGLVMTGGSDWHGDGTDHRASIGTIPVPGEWLENIERLHESRRSMP